MGLTVKRVARLTKPGRYLDNLGLYLQVISATNRSWLLRYELRGKKRWMGLGSAGPAHAPEHTKTFTLEEARKRARAARQLLADGIDPLETRHKTFAAVTKEYFDANEAGWSLGIAPIFSPHSSILRQSTPCRLALLTKPWS